MQQRSPDLVVRVLLFTGWGFAVVSLVNPEEPPFCVFAIVAGALIGASGVVLASDGGRAMARLNERYAPWQTVPRYRWMAGGLIFIGAVWLVVGIASTLS
jgi:hypothetical protein